MGYYGKVLHFPNLKLKVYISNSREWNESQLLTFPSTKRHLIALYVKGLQNVEEAFTVFLHEIGHYLLWQYFSEILLDSNKPEMKFTIEYLAWVIADYLSSQLQFPIVRWIVEKSLGFYFQNLFTSK